jgi:hypothetical protein
MSSPSRYIAALAELIAREQTGIRKSGKEIALLWAWLELLKKEHCDECGKKFCARWSGESKIVAGCSWEV